MSAMIRMKAARSLSALRAVCVLLAFAAISSAAWAQSGGDTRAAAGIGSACGPAGYVHEVSGVATIQRASAKEVPAKVGDLFEAGTVLRTGNDGKEILKFADGQVVALGPNSALHIGRYCYLAGNLRQSVSRMELTQGEMRYVTGLIGAANREGIHITAGNSMLDIRNPGGADFTVVVNPQPEEVGAAVVARGEISVRTPYGPIYKIEAGQYVPWQPGRAPPPPMPIAAAPAVLQAAVAGLWATVVPTGTPVVVASAARAAVAAAAAGMAQVVASADPKLAGYVDTVSSNVSIRTASGKTANARIGAVFEAGSTFNTGTDGQVVLKFADGQVVVLGPGSILGVDQYQFDPGNIKASKSALDLVNGTMRFVSGVIHTDNHEGVSISAGASLIDILNAGAADFTLSVNTKREEIGVAAVAAGEISVHTPYGPISKIDAGQAAPWQPGKAALPVVPLGAAPASLQALVATVSMAAMPESTPVLVQPAALAAATVAAATQAQAAANADPGNPRLQAAAQAAAEQATKATETATAGSQAVAATVFASTLAALPATAAGPAQAQVPSAPPLALPLAPVAPTVTPGGGVLTTCSGSPC